MTLTLVAGMQVDLLNTRNLGMGCGFISILLRGES